MSAWAVVTARGGSKSIPLKNLVSLGGRPLLDYGVRAAQASGSCRRIICSTDHDAIAARARELGTEVDRRPAELAGDEASSNAVVGDLLDRLAADAAPLPDVIVLIQPTSPFLLPSHVSAVIDRLAGDPTANSAHTVVQCTHHNHAWNQREIVGGHARFLFAEQRKEGYNKQRKPKLYTLGNLIAVRTVAMRASGSLYAEPSATVEISRPHEFDLDVAADIPLAEAIIAAGLVDLSHLDPAAPSRDTKTIG
ncbi:MAG: acylneuraminate cytidylyltransferase family protein [Hyphomicrobiales bacterium]|nr:acylneuraminate cytidylyltransferase family protein [Hyphomicrobiales bacterium]